MAQARKEEKQLQAQYLYVLSRCESLKENETQQVRPRIIRKYMIYNPDHYQFDGEVHILSENFCYVSLKLVNGIECIKEIELCKYLITDKYFEYIYEVDKKKSIQFMNRTLNLDDEIYLTCRPPCLLDSLATPGSSSSQVAVISIKFVRSPNDEKFFKERK